MWKDTIQWATLPLPDLPVSHMLVLVLACSFAPPVSISLLNQHHDTTCFHQMLYLDPSCEVCTKATTEVNQQVLPKVLEDATLSVSPLTSTASMIESSFIQSSAFSADPPGDLIPPPLPEPFLPYPSVLSSNSMTPLGNFLSPSSPGQTMSPDLFLSLGVSILRGLFPSPTP